MNDVIQVPTKPQRTKKRRKHDHQGWAQIKISKSDQIRSRPAANAVRSDQIRSQLPEHAVRSDQLRSTQIRSDHDLICESDQIKIRSRLGRRLRLADPWHKGGWCVLSSKIARNRPYSQRTAQLCIICHHCDHRFPFSSVLPFSNCLRFDLILI